MKHSISVFEIVTETVICPFWYVRSAWTSCALTGEFVLLAHAVPYKINTSPLNMIVCPFMQRSIINDSVLLSILYLQEEELC